MSAQVWAQKNKIQPKEIHIACTSIGGIKSIKFTTVCVCFSLILILYVDALVDTPVHLINLNLFSTAN